MTAFAELTVEQNESLGMDNKVHDQLYAAQSALLREIHGEEMNERAADEKKEWRRMREVEWCKWTSNSSGTQSAVHVTADGLTTLCNKKIPQIHESNLNGVKQRCTWWVSGTTSSATGGTTYDTFVRYSSTVMGSLPAPHEHYGNCKCCAKRSNDKFTNNHRTAS